jgi:hypothetical protein
MSTTDTTTKVEIVPWWSLTGLWLITDILLRKLQRRLRK